MSTATVSESTLLAKPLTDWLVQHVSQRHQEQLQNLKHEPSRQTHNPTKVREGINLVLGLKENPLNLDQIEDIGLRWTDRDDHLFFDSSGKQVPQAIFLLIRLSTKDHLILITGPDLENFAHASAHRATSTGLQSKRDVILIDRQRFPEEFAAYALKAAFQLEESTTLYGTPHQRTAKVSYRDLAAETLARISKLK